jgi:hypothetical protein
LFLRVNEIHADEPGTLLKIDTYFSPCPPAKKAWLRDFGCQALSVSFPPLPPPYFKEGGLKS